MENTGVRQDEGQHIQSVYKPARMLGGPGSYIFHPEARMDEEHELANHSVATKIMSDWEPFFNLDKFMLVEKSPPNLVRTRFLQKLFPNSCFIVILRHPIAVAYATEKFSDLSLSKLIEHTLLGYEIFEEDRKYLSNCFVIKYEELVKDPAIIMSNIFQFLGLDPFPVTLNVDATINQKYFNMWEVGESGASKDVKESIIKEFETRANFFSYSFTTLG